MHGGGGHVERDEDAAAAATVGASVIIIYTNARAAHLTRGRPTGDRVTAGIRGLIPSSEGRRAGG